MSDMDTLISTIVSDAQQHTGQPASWMKFHGVKRAVVAERSERNPEWSDEEDAFLRANLGRISAAQISVRLGRSENAIKIHRMRDGVPAARKQPGYLTSHQAGVLLGLDSHTMPAWIDKGIFPGEIMPDEFGTRRVSLMKLKIWITRPEHWPYFKVNLIRNAYLRRLVELAQARWGDEWLSSRQVADLSGCGVDDVKRWIKLGKLPALRCPHICGRHEASWAFWFIKRSDVGDGLVIPRGAGRQVVNWSPRADAFILRNRAEGKGNVEIARMMGWNVKRVEYRYRMLTKVPNPGPSL